MNTLEELRSTEFSNEFTEHMFNAMAMAMSYYKYGHINNYVSNKSLDYINKEMEAFTKDGNTEHMVNIANYTMIRYMLPQAKEGYKPTDSDASTHNATYKTVTEWLWDYIKENN